MSRSAVEFLNVKMPVNEMKSPSAMARRARSATAGKAMQHGREGALPCFLFEDARHVVVGVARMDHQRQPGFARRRDVAAKAALLRLARRVVVVIVEAGLADRHDLGVPRARDQVARRHVQFLVGVVRMGADRAEDVGKSLGDRQHLGVARDPRRDGDQAADAGRARAGDHAVELGGEIREIEMAMAVDQHGYCAAFSPGST